MRMTDIQDIVMCWDWQELVTYRMTDIQDMEMCCDCKELVPY
jgi:hypothetical protein